MGLASYITALIQRGAVILAVDKDAARFRPARIRCCGAFCEAASTNATEYDLGFSDTYPARSAAYTAEEFAAQAAEEETSETFSAQLC